MLELDLTRAWSEMRAAQIAAFESPPPLSDPITTYRYLEGRRRTIRESARQRPLLRLWDKNHDYLGQIAQERSVRVEEIMADTGGGNIVIRRDNWLSDFILYDRRAEEDLHFTLDPIPTKPDWRTRWGGKVIGVGAKRDTTGLHTVELEMVSNREHLKHILAGCNPLFPPEVQMPKLWLLPWNCRTAIFITLFINLCRQFFPLLSIPSNIANPGGWLHGGHKGWFGLNPLAWPIQPQFVNPLTDQSRFTVMSSRWSDMHTVTTPLLEDAGCMIRAYTWLTEDTTSPHPELGEGALGQLSRPHRNAIILAVEDKSGTTGPTGTLADGVIKLATQTADNAITETIVPFLPGDIGMSRDDPTKVDPFIQKLFMTAPAPPWVVWREHEHSGIIDANRQVHSATARTIMTGGKSPGWVNSLQTFLIKFALSQLQTVLVTGLFESMGEAPVGSGLEELYQGYLDDTLLAYQRITDPVRAIRMGDMGFLEHWESGSGSAYTVSGVFSLRTGHWKTRAYTSFQTSVRNMAPYGYGVDFQLGDRLGFQMANAIHVDQCSAVRFSYDKSSPINIELSIGREVDELDPLARATRTLAQLWNVVGVFFGSQDLF